MRRCRLGKLARAGVGGTAMLAVALATGTAQAKKTTAEEWAAQLQYLKIPGAKLAYLDVGKGDPVVLVHGAAGDYRAWLAQLKALSSEHRVIAYSRRFHFPNDIAEGGREYSLSQHAHDLEALIVGLKLAPAHLVAHAYGANVAVLLAMQHPELVRTLVLAEPGLPDLMKGTGDAERYGSERLLMIEQARMALRGDFNELGLERVVEWFYGPLGLEAIPPPGLQRMADNVGALRLQFLHGTPSPRIGCDEVAAISCPVLYLEGAKSPWHAHAMADAFMRCRPATRRVTLPRVSHGMAWDEPKTFNKVVLGFMRQQDLAGN